MYEQNVIEALARLRHAAKHSDDISNPLARAFQALDNAGVFAALDEQTDYAAAEDILAESAREAAGYAVRRADADLAQHQGLIAEPKNTPLDEPLIGRQADRVRDELDAAQTFGPRDVWAARARAVEDIRPKGRSTDN